MLHEPGTGWRFWATDGTAAGTTPFLLPLGAEHDQASSPPALLGADGEALYWAFADDVVGREPWVTDRHGLGAILVGDLCPEDCSSDPFAPRALVAGGMTFGASVEGDRGLWFTSASAPAAFPLLPPGGLEGSLESTDYGYLGRETTAPSGTEPWAVRLTVPCSENATTLCLNDGRFAVRAAWRSKTDAGQGQVFPLTDDTGAFWFFGPRNLELVVKVLDACKTAFESFWVYASGLTDVEVELTIDDSAGGGTQRYRNELDTPFVLVRDISAFGCE
jgi:ELWxxDGT repeat protein